MLSSPCVHCNKPMNGGVFRRPNECPHCRKLQDARFASDGKTLVVAEPPTNIDSPPVVDQVTDTLDQASAVPERTPEQVAALKEAKALKLRREKLRKQEALKKRAEAEQSQDKQLASTRASVKVATPAVERRVDTSASNRTPEELKKIAAIKKAKALKLRQEQLRKAALLKQKRLQDAANQTEQSAPVKKSADKRELSEAELLKAKKIAQIKKARALKLRQEQLKKAAILKKKKELLAKKQAEQARANANEAKPVSDNPFLSATSKYPKPR